MSDPLAEALRGLKREYLRESVARVAELEELLAQVAAGGSEALDRLRRALHRLAGSGGSYGFADVSRHSRSGEEIARRLMEAGSAPQPADVAALTEVVSAVRAAFEVARAAEGDPAH
jgi:chemotaxis protein histidine kinase CheA